jgi:hypothetical protein
MANRRVDLMGSAFSDTGNVTISIQLNNNEVFTGAIIASPTQDDETQANAVATALCSFDIDSALSGNLPLVITATGGILYFANLHAVAWKDSEHTVMSSDAGDINSNTTVSDGKTNAMVDGEPQVLDASVAMNENGTVGDWHYRIPDNSTLTCDIMVDDINIAVDPT